MTVEQKVFDKALNKVHVDYPDCSSIISLSAHSAWIKFNARCYQAADKFPTEYNKRIESEGVVMAELLILQAMQTEIEARSRAWA